MLERFKSTGKKTGIGRAQFPKLFNAGVGGDKTQNVVYRLGLKDLYSGLQERGIEVAILHMGSNNLTPRRGLTVEAIKNYSLTLEALRRISPGVVILLTAIHYRKDIDRSLVDQSNTDLRQLVCEFNGIGDDAYGTLKCKYVISFLTTDSAFCTRQSRDYSGSPCGSYAS